MFQRLGDEGLPTGLCLFCGGIDAPGAVLGQLMRRGHQGFWATKLIRSQIQYQVLFGTIFSHMASIQFATLPSIFHHDPSMPVPARPVKIPF